MAHSMHWLAAGALLLAALGFAHLGRWQLERAEQNRATTTLFDAAAVMPPLRQPVAEPERYRYRTIRLQGRYVPASQVLLDNMTNHGVAGYQVMTPFRVEEEGIVAGEAVGDGGGLVLVNRGWVPAPPDRSVLPDVALALPDVNSVFGRIDRLPRAALELDAPASPRPGSVTVLSFPDYAAIEAALGAEVLRFQLLLDPQERNGFVREWGPDPNRANRNIAYAVQWFGLALLALVLAIGVAIKGRRRVPREAA